MEKNKTRNGKKECLVRVVGLRGRDTQREGNI